MSFGYLENCRALAGVETMNVADPLPIARSGLKSSRRNGSVSTPRRAIVSLPNQRVEVETIRDNAFTLARSGIRPYHIPWKQAPRDGPVFGESQPQSVGPGFDRRLVDPSSVPMHERHQSAFYGGNPSIHMHCNEVRFAKFNRLLDLLLA